MRRKQKTGKPGYTCEGPLETEERKEARSTATLESAEKNGASDLLERILHRENLNAAYERVKQNGGAAGTDGMTVNDMLAHLREHGGELLARIREGKYKPKPVRRVEIPKPDGGVRLLGVPTVIDRMLESRGHRFVRYADDCNIYVRSRRAAERVMASCTRFLEGKLRLKVNREKSQVGNPLQLKFLGFSLYEKRGRMGIRPHEKSLKRFKEKVRTLTSRNQGKSIEAILANLKRYTTGWLGYYSIADMQTKMKAVNGWIRRRIRQILWKRWKRIKTRHDNLKRLGVEELQAWKWANSRLGSWRVAGSKILAITLTNARLEALGYDDIAKRYQTLHLSY